MKKLFLIVIATLSGVQVSFSQIKILKAVQQKTFAGMGGVFINYLIDFNGKSSEKVEIDSVKSIADASMIKFGFTKFEPCCKNEISFGYALSKSPKCRTCTEVTLQPYNLTKGVIIYYRYYRRGERKSFFTVKKFKQLPDLRTP